MLLNHNYYFVGRAGTGKSSCTKYLQENYGYTITKFAHPVYAIAQNYFKMKEKDRQLLQIIGTDAGRQWIDSNIWVNRFKEDLHIVTLTCGIMCKPLPKFCSDDVRFMNEHKTLKSMGWIGIYLDCPDNIRYQRLEQRDKYTQAQYNSHSSETSIDEFKSELIKLDASKPMTEMLLDLEKLINDSSS